jgi:hypothetical protein
MSRTIKNDFSLGYGLGAGWRKRKKVKNKKKIRRIKTKRSSDFRLGFETGKADRKAYF